MDFLNGYFGMEFLKANVIFPLLSILKCVKFGRYFSNVVIKNPLEKLPRNGLYLSYIIVIYWILKRSLLKLNTERLESWLSWRCLLFTLQN